MRNGWNLNKLNLVLFLTVYNLNMYAFSIMHTDESSLCNKCLKLTLKTSRRFTGDTSKHHLIWQQHSQEKQCYEYQREDAWNSLELVLCYSEAFQLEKQTKQKQKQYFHQCLCYFGCYDMGSLHIMQTIYQDYCFFSVTTEEENPCP